MHARIGWQNLRTTEFLDDGKYLLITGTDFVDGKIDFTRCYYVKQERYNQDRNIQIKNGCILITKDGTLGKVAYVNGLNKPATLNAGIFNVEIRDENKVDRLYLYQYIKAPFLLEYVNQMATGGTIKHLNQNILVDFMVSMPQSMEQKKIGELFQILDHLITLHQRKLEKLKIIKRSMLENLFPKNGEKTPKIRFSGFTEDWEQRKAKELCTIGTGESNTQDQAEDGMYTFYIRSEIPVKSNKYLYDCEAVITIGDGNIGRVFHYVNGKFDLHQRCYKMTDFENVWGKYFYYFFSTRFYDRAMKMTAKATVDSVRIEMISEMYILKPAEINEQKNIADFFTHLDHLITLHQSKPFGHILKVIASYTLYWEQRKLGEIAERLTRKNEKLESTLPLTISAQYGLIDQNEFFDKRIASKDVRGYYLIKKGEFAYNKSTSVDAPFGAIKRLDKYNKGVLSTLYILFKIIDDTNTSSDYLVTYYSTDLWHKGIQLIAAEGARNHGLLNITPNDFFKTMLSIPLNVFEQQKIGNFFKSLDHLITLHQLEPFKLIFKAIAYRIIDYAKSKPPRYIKYADLN